MANIRRFLADGITRLGGIPYSELLLTGSIQSSDLSDGSVTGPKIGTDAVDASKIAAGAVGNSELATDSVDASKIAASAVGSSEIAASSVSDAKITDVAPGKITGGSSGFVLSHNGSTPTWSDVGSLPPTSATARPAGEVSWTAAASAPSGWLVCDGAAYGRVAQAALFAAIGTLHGVGDGSTTFNVPDMRDRSPRGKAAATTVGQTGGADTVTLVEDNLPSHDHPLSGSTAAISAGTPSGSVVSASAGTPAGSVSIVSGGAHTHTGDRASAVDGTSSSIITNVKQGTGNWLIFQTTNALSAGSHSHSASFSGSAMAAHGHSFSGSALPTHSHALSGNTGLAGSGTAVDVKPKHVVLLPIIKT